MHTHYIFLDSGGYPTGGPYPTGGYGPGYITTAVGPRGPIGSPLGLGGSNALGNYGLGSLPPKIRVIFIPQGGAPAGSVQ